MNKFYFSFLLLVSLGLFSCQANNTSPNRSINNTQQVNPKIPVNTEKFIIDENFSPIVGQIIYVPVYSHIYFMNKRRQYDLAANISIHNTDLETPIIIKSVKYYNSQGKVVENYLAAPVKLNSFASTDFFIEVFDRRGGLGANFLIEWVAEKKVSAPIVESVMVGTGGNQGISFLTKGRVIKEHESNRHLQREKN
ncbi:MAG: DUF3124 domain-containing protein [Prochloraceae cyanobacterium]|nr:DUF3124 domain-containing protein [Prochloraceae cyanobacterium]